MSRRKIQEAPSALAEHIVFDGLCDFKEKPPVQQPSVGFDFDGVFVEDATFDMSFKAWIKIHPVKAFLDAFSKVKPIKWGGDIPSVCPYIEDLPNGSTVAVITGRVLNEHQLTKRQLMETCGGMFVAKKLRVMLFVNKDRKKRTRSETPELAGLKTILHKAHTINSLGLEIFYESDQSQVDKLTTLCPNTKVLLFRPYESK